MCCGSAVVLDRVFTAAAQCSSSGVSWGLSVLFLVVCHLFLFLSVHPQWVSLPPVLHCADRRLRSVWSVCESINGGSLPVALSSKKKKKGSENSIVKGLRQEHTTTTITRVTTDCCSNVNKYRTDIGFLISLFQSWKIVKIYELPSHILNAVQYCCDGTRSETLETTPPFSWWASLNHHKAFRINVQCPHQAVLLGWGWLVMTVQISKGSQFFL